MGCGSGLRLDEHRSTRPAIGGIRRAMPVFDASIQIEHRCVAPALIAGLRCEEVPIALVAARPDHRVDARPTAQHFPHAQRNSAAVEAGIRCGLELPISLGPEILDPPIGVHDVRRLIVSARLQEQHGDVGILGEPARHDRARGTRSANNEVIDSRLKCVVHESPVKY